MHALTTQIDINFLFVFIEGIISFFSPCILPILPLYLSYLSGNAKQEKEDGSIYYKQSKVLLNTVFFILGICTTFVILGVSFSSLGSFLEGNSIWFSRFGGLLIIIFGFIQLGLFHPQFLNREFRIKHKQSGKMNLFTAFGMGFLFSFSWTPCVGPMLSSVLILAGGSGSAITGTILVLLYALGFVIPFLLLGLFTTSALNLLKKYQKAMSLIIKIGGIILIIIGANMIWSTMQGNSTSISNGNTPTDQQTQAAPDITFTDLEGNKQTLQQFKGKSVYVLFWAEWCGYCKSELPIIEELYKEYGNNKKDVVFVSVVMPDNQYTLESYQNFVKENEYSFPVYVDDGTAFSAYGISSFPTTYTLDKEGNIFGYTSGMLEKDVIKDIIKQTQENKKK